MLISVTGSRLQGACWSSNLPATTVTVIINYSLKLSQYNTDLFFLAICTDHIIYWDKIHQCNEYRNKSLLKAPCTRIMINICLCCPSNIAYSCTEEYSWHQLTWGCWFFHLHQCKHGFNRLLIFHVCLRCLWISCKVCSPAFTSREISGKVINNHWKQRIHLMGMTLCFFFYTKSILLCEYKQVCQLEVYIVAHLRLPPLLPLGKQAVHRLRHWPWPLIIMLSSTMVSFQKLR